MNLIEKLGGYDRAKKLVDDCKRYGRSDVKVPVNGGFIHIVADFLELDLLEYRRQHNIFESEDKIVVKNDCLIDFADLTLNLKVLTVLMMTDEGFIRSIEAAGLFKSSLVRHATPEEIAAGRRL